MYISELQWLNANKQKIIAEKLNFLERDGEIDLERIFEQISDTYRFFNNSFNTFITKNEKSDGFNAKYNFDLDLS